jgi:hypothetical protein
MQGQPLRPQSHGWTSAVSNIIRPSIHCGWPRLKLPVWLDTIRFFRGGRAELIKHMQPEIWG